VVLCGKAISVRAATQGGNHILSVLIRTSGLVDIHPVLVLPPSRGTLARILLLPQTLRDLLEH
jgi:hypothetical protein